MPFSDKEPKAWGSHRLGAVLGLGSVPPAPREGVFRGYLLSLERPREPIFPPWEIWRASLLWRVRIWLLLFPHVQKYVGQLPLPKSTQGWETYKNCIPRSFFVLNKILRQLSEDNYEKQNPNEQQFQVVHGISPYQVTHRLPPEAQRSDLCNALVTTLISTLLSGMPHLHSALHNFLSENGPV